MNGGKSNGSKLSDEKKKEQNLKLNRFMIQTFTKGLLFKYSSLFIENYNENDTNVEPLSRLLKFDYRKTPVFFETLLKRSNSSIVQFKKVCCIMVKFLQCCTNETNYMKFLKYNLHKLIVSCFILSIPNVTGTEADKIENREKSYILYSKMTGLSVSEITNCCSIVRPIIIRRSRNQYNALLYTNTSSYNNSENRFNVMTDTILNYDASNNYYHHFVPPRTISPSDIHITTGNSSSSDSTNYNGNNNERQSSPSADNPLTSSNGYILGTEMEQFNELGKKLVIEYFRVV
ncbi:hypothetical protein KAFR_0H01490 [Kazachstania africana CBS 2517]|uniref:Uncharacterized protein n=1 Tax=Kazachstania africana (strain ATCC 22294 / BCRC 22015 / CBS 2517 / CECT 1963 / NBRC 1671 / NRRL Y-8276) TaxID=1071382 RepID=H2AZ03_KAZAF|nr:hypothetical protein KAFR_0H01490 [Kazachstania africana CBS 2517]CCF59559.1 hypothetical protein KAFR_0H01490 [Kazachstania africana CBS 2517]